MDANSNLINSVADGQVVPCPACGVQNKPESKFCVGCGKSLAAPAEAPAFAPAEPAFAPAEATVAEEKIEEASTPAFASAEEKAEESAPAFAPAEPKAAPVKYEEAPSAFADGLPEWSIEPPQVMVRRH